MNGQLAIPAGHPMSPWLDDLAAKYGPIMVGATIGLSAKWALVLAEGRNLSWRMIAIDMLLAPMVLLLTFFAAVKFHMDPVWAAMLASLFALASDRVIRLIRLRFLQKVDHEFQAYLQHTKGLIREEVQAELSGQNIIDDTLKGKAPPTYKANKTWRLP